jgi:hypothetical protein
MGLESGDYINDLNQANPDGSTDQVSTLDNHINLIKKVLRQSFSDIGKEVSASAGDLNQWSKIVVNAFWLSALTEGSATAAGMLSTLAPLESPEFTGSPKVPTASVSDSSSLVASTSFVRKEIVEVKEDLAEDYILIQDQKASGTQGGGATSGAWRTRDLNTEVVDTGNHASVAANAVTLAGGTYRFRGRAPAYTVNQHQAQLYNVTDSTAVAAGTCEMSNPTYPTTTSSEVAGRFVISASAAFTLRHRVDTTKATNGFGRACSFGTEVYAQIEFWRKKE